MTMSRRFSLALLVAACATHAAAAQHAGPPVTRIPSMQASGVTATSVADPLTIGTYSYDGSGNIKSIASSARTDVYVYDAFGRLTKSTAGVNQPSSSYTYDRFGNMLSMTLNGTTVELGASPVTNRLTKTVNANNQPVYHGTYDAAGRVTGLADGSAFTHDALGMMTSSTAGMPPGKKSVYLYTAGGERIATITASGSVEEKSEWTLRDQSGKVLRRIERAAPGAPWVWRQDYIYRGSQLLASEINTAPRTLQALRDDRSSNHWNLLWVPPFAMFSCKTQATRLLVAARYYQHLASASTAGDGVKSDGSAVGSSPQSDTSYDEILRRGSTLEALTYEAANQRK